jgi:hypothetical protein
MFQLDWNLSLVRKGNKMLDTNPVDTVLNQATNFRYRALLLSPQWKEYLPVVMKRYPAAKYNAAIRCFFLPSGALLWLGPIPQQLSECSRWHGMRLHVIAVEGEVTKEVKSFLQERIAGADDSAEKSFLTLKESHA